MIERDHVPVAVIGAGPSGITAATLLAQYGIDVLILDRWAGVYPQPRAVHLDDEVYRILDRLGVAERFAQISRPAAGLRLMDGNLETIAEFQRDSALSSNGFPQANMFDQPELEALLRANLADHPRVRLRGDVEVTDIAGDPTGTIRITATDRSDGHPVVITADYVLGCDGANSLVRNRIGSVMRDLNFEQRWLVVDIATDADLNQWEGVHQVCDPHRAGTYMRIGTRRYRWEFRLLPGETVDDYATLGDLRPLIAPWTADIADAELDVVRVTEYTFRAQIADRWRRDNIFLLGDAAHLTPPFIGQGMGAGLRDAMNLAWKLAGVLQRSLPESVLDTYEAERKPHALHLIRLAQTIGHAMTSGGRVGDLTRRVVAPKLQLLPGLRAKILDSETPRLHASELVHRPLRAGLAGRLCPNTLLGNGRRLDAEIGPGFAVIATAPLTDHQRALADRCGARVVIAEPGSTLAGWLRRGRASAVAVRPDRTVLKAGRDVTAVCRSLPTFHVAATSPGSIR